MLLFCVLLLHFPHQRKRTATRQDPTGHNRSLVCLRDGERLRWPEHPLLDLDMLACDPGERREFHMLRSTLRAILLFSNQSDRRQALHPALFLVVHHNCSRRQSLALNLVQIRHAELLSQGCRHRYGNSKVSSRQGVK